MYFWFTFIFHYLESISIIPNMTENKIVIKDINFVWILFIFYINMFFFFGFGFTCFIQISSWSSMTTCKVDKKQFKRNKFFMWHLRCFICLVLLCMYQIN